MDWHRSVPAQTLERMLCSAQGRLIEARVIADRLRHDAALHRLAMRAVFALEDSLYAIAEAHQLATAASQEPF